MSLGNQDIETHVNTIVTEVLKGKKITKDDQVAVASVVAIITNLLQNFNDIAYYMINEDQRRNDNR